MNITLTATEVGRYRRANPDNGLDGLTNITFMFDADGNVIDCKGIALGKTNLVGPGLSRLCDIARARLYPKIEQR